MFDCIDCHDTFEDSKSFLRHFDLFHINNGSYRCGDSNCLRVFSSMNSLRKHMKSKHLFDVDNEKIYKKETNKLPDTDMEIDSISIVQPEPSTSADRNIFVENQPKNMTASNVNDEITFDYQCKRTTVYNLEEKFALFAAKLYSYPDVTRSKSLCIINDTLDFLKETLNAVQENVLASVSKFILDDKLLSNIKNIFGNVTSRHCNKLTEQNIFRMFKNLGTFSEPQEYLLGEVTEFVKSKNLKKLKQKEIYAQFIPMRHTLKQFLELPGMYNQIINYIESLQDTTIISNFIQCNLWKELNANNIDRIVFPIHLFFDDYETNNPLGSHKGIAKCGALYCTLPCLPPWLSSKLENIFLVALSNTLDRKAFTNSVLFSKIIDELKHLDEYGIVIKGDIERKVYFKMGLFLGDNLGIHEVLGFCTGFKASSFCRFCRIDKVNIQNCFYEDSNLIRNKLNYDSDVLLNDRKKTGVVEECAFHKLSNFHVTCNISVDVLHDMLEGICQYDTGLILDSLIKKKYFKLDELNSLIKGFHYGPYKNTPPEILTTHISKKRLLMSGAEMLVFIRHLPMIIYHLVPHNIDEWDLILQLQNIVEISVSKNFYKNSHFIFKYIIADYLQSLTTLFGECLKPKHHFLTHYPRIFGQSGPFSGMSSIRFEGKHKEAKMTCKVSLNRKNVCRTIAYKHQLHLNFRYLSRAQADEQNYDPSKVIMKHNQALINFEKFSKILPEGFRKLTYVNLVENISINGNFIAVNDVVMLPSEHCLLFYNIMYIIIYDKQIFIITEKFLDVSYDIYVNAFEVMTNKKELKVLTSECMYGCSVTHKIVTHDGKEFIIKNWF